MAGIGGFRLSGWSEPRTFAGAGDGGEEDLGVAMMFEELDDTTRAAMLEEFESEWGSGLRYEPCDLTDAGLTAFPQLGRAAIESGDDDALTLSLMAPEYWQPTRTVNRRGKLVTQRINVRSSSELLGRHEFNTWYVRGLAKRLMSEGVESCQIYRAASPKYAIAECTLHEGEVRPVNDLYNGHRARYWPEVNDQAFRSLGSRMSPRHPPVHPVTWIVCGIWPLRTPERGAHTVSRNRLNCSVAEQSRNSAWVALRSVAPLHRRQGTQAAFSRTLPRGRWSARS